MKVKYEGPYRARFLSGEWRVVRLIGERVHTEVDPPRRYPEGKRTSAYACMRRFNQRWKEGKS